MHGNKFFARTLVGALSCCLTFAGLAQAHAADFTIPTRDGVGISYSVTPVVDAPERYIGVKVQFEVAGAPDKVSIQMPVWSPGDYHIQNHAKFVKDLKAFSMGNNGAEAPLAVTHPDANTWDIATGGAAKLDVQYRVPETEPGIFSDNVRLQTHFGFFNGPSALIYVVDHKVTPSQLAVNPPTGWTCTAPLPQKVSGADVLPNVFTAPDYDTLADSPVALGDKLGLKVVNFQQDATDFKVVLLRNPAGLADVSEMTRVLKLIAHTESELMGGMPTTHYNFIFDLDGPGGGLEHLNSFRIGIPSFLQPTRYVSMIAHEFFHQWNVKRIRPESLGPFNYIDPPKTHNLWFAEGVTEYYAQICTHRAGFTSNEQLLAHYRGMISYMSKLEARKSVTAEDASFRVWESGNSQGFGGLSYYLKGEMIGFLLDLKIRSFTNSSKSLDDVMRLLMKRHVQPNPGYGEDELRTAVNEVAGQDLTALYNQLVRSTAELPTEEILEPFGLGNDMAPMAGETPAQRNLREAWLGGTKK